MPVDPKTGKEYPYTEEGIKQHKEDTSFKMRGSPFQRNFGIGEKVTPIKDNGNGDGSVDVTNDQKYTKSKQIANMLRITE